MDNLAYQKNLRAFQLKGSLLTLTVFELLKFDLPDIRSQLLSFTKQTPDLFHRMPVIIDLAKIKDSPCLIDFQTLKALLEQHGFVPVGIRGGNTEHEKSASLANLAVLNHARQEGLDKKTACISTGFTTEQQFPSKVITTPVRSGQQIYAKNTDLIIIGTVSHGAEILADGNIHVYGTLHGRALAGVNGNKQACVFCHQLKAELISIAGIYWVNEDIAPFFNTGTEKKAPKTQTHHQTIQVSLHNEKLHISLL